MVADHGYAFDIGAKSRRLVSESTIDEVGPVPLFIKAPGQMEGDVDESLVRNIDMVPTIAEQLGTRLWWPHDGRSVNDAESERTRRGGNSDAGLSRVIRIGRDELAQRRRANRLRWARKFGTGSQSRLMFGDPWASVYRVGPNLGLLTGVSGRSTSGPRAAAGGRARR